LVARLTGGQEVAGSNPVAPTKEKAVTTGAFGSRGYCFNGKI
jgi:hypothetical protein